MEQRLKERLFGAIIVVALFVIFLPMVLKEPEGEVISHHELTPKPLIPKKDDWMAVPESLAQWQEKVESTSSPVRQEVSQPSWVIQVATFANNKNAQKLKSRLNQKGYQAYLEAVPNHEKTLTWVLIGPLEDKETAELVQGKLQSDFKVKSLVTTISRG